MWRIISLGLCSALAAWGCDDTRATLPRDAGPGSDGGIITIDAGDRDAGPGEFFEDAGARDAGIDAGRDAGPVDALDAGRDAMTPPLDAGTCPSGLAAWYRFEDTSGAVLDECGGHHGLPGGSGYTRGVSGRYGSAIEFHGSDGHVVVPASSALDFASAATIELWVRVDTTGVGSTVSRGTGNNDDNVLMNTSCWNMQTIFSRSSSGGGTTNVTSACDALPVGGWAHIAVVNDGAELRLYIDGALVLTQPGGLMGPMSSDLYIGRRSQGIFPFDGAIDDIKWWTIARTQPEICADAGGTWTGSSCTL